MKSRKSSQTQRMMRIFVAFVLNCLPGTTLDNLCKLIMHILTAIFWCKYYYIILIPGFQAEKLKHIAVTKHVQSYLTKICQSCNWNLINITFGMVLLTAVHSFFREISSPPFSQANADNWELVKRQWRDILICLWKSMYFCTFFTFRALSLDYLV